MTRRWNALHPLAGKDMPLRAKLDDKWRERTLRESMEGGLTMEAHNAAAAEIVWGLQSALLHTSPNHVALLMVQAAESLATPHLGRPIASGGFKASELDGIMWAIWTNEDGTPADRRRAIAAEVAKVPPHKRRALRVWLRRNLPPAPAHKSANRLWIPTASQLRNR